MTEATSEQLLEALLNLERARQHEHNMRVEAEALLEGVRAINSVQRSGDLFQSLADVLRTIIDFDEAIILQQNNDNALIPLASSTSKLQHTVWETGKLFNKVLSGKPIAAFDVSIIPEWQDQPSRVRKNVGSALHIPLAGGSNKTILICTHPEKRHFGPTQVKKAQHFAPLASQALLTLELQRTLLERDRFFELSLDLMAIIDFQGRFRQFNSAWTETLGYQEQRLSHYSIYDLIYQKDRLTFLGVIEALKQSNKRLTHEFRFNKRSGEYRWLSCSIASYADEQIYIVARDVTKQKLENELAQQQRLTAEKANEAKSQFLANMSHEIRTPLTAIIGFAETMLELSMNEKDRLDATSLIIKNGKHLLLVINEILDLAKIESGKLEIEKIDFSLFELIHDVKSLLAIQAQEKGLELKVDYSFPLPKKIVSDPTRIKQILLNLGNNAIKFTQKGSVTIGVTCFKGDQKIQFTIKDTGIGISPEQMDRLFTPFTQADQSTTRKYGGSGLGLCISKQLSELLGGGIAVSSREGIGSDFTVTVATGDLYAQQFDNDISEVIKKTSSTSKPSIPKLKGRILLAEDTLDNQRLISHYIAKTGAVTDIADNGEIALKLGMVNHYDLILMDMQMPVMDGIESTQRLRKQGCSTPIVALTANATAQDKEKCRAAGSTNFLSKPIEWPTFFAILAQYLPASGTREDSPIVPELDDDDEDFMFLVINFVNGLSKRMERIETQLENKNWEELRQALHDLKGSGTSFGYPTLTELSAKLEADIKSGSLDGIPEGVKSLSMLIERIKLGTGS